MEMLGQQFVASVIGVACHVPDPLHTTAWNAWKTTNYKMALVFLSVQMVRRCLYFANIFSIVCMCHLVIHIIWVILCACEAIQRLAIKFRS